MRLSGIIEKNDTKLKWYGVWTESSGVLDEMCVYTLHDEDTDLFEFLDDETISAIDADARQMYNDRQLPPEDYDTIRAEEARERRWEHMTLGEIREDLS